MAYSFDKGNFEEDNEEVKRLPNLTDDIIYCPKCGTVNTFEDDSMKLMKNCFCERCGTRLNDFWDKYNEGELAIVHCEYCAEATFFNQKFCVHCGAKQKRVSSERLKQLQKESGKVDLLDLGERVFTTDSKEIITNVQNKIIFVVVITIILLVIIGGFFLLIMNIGEM